MEVKRVIAIMEGEPIPTNCKYLSSGVRVSPPPEKEHIPVFYYEMPEKEFDIVMRARDAMMKKMQDEANKTKIIQLPGLTLPPT